MKRMIAAHFFSSKKLLVVIWLLAIAFRLQNFLIPPIDAHPMRQTDTESVAYYFATTDHNPLHPQASLIRPQTNIYGYFFLEFPAYEYLIGTMYRIFGTSYIVARLINVLLFSVSFALLFKTIEKLFSEKLAIWTVLLFSFTPSSVFFWGHAIHPDIFAITTVVSSLYVLQSNKRNLFTLSVAGVLFALSVGTRPFILMALPSLLSVLFFKKAKWWEYLVFSVLSVSIYGFWSWWQQLSPEADAAWQQWTLQGREALFSFAGWKHLIWRNTSGEVLGRVATVLAAVGLGSLLIKSRSVFKLFQQFSLQKIIKGLATVDTISADTRLLVFCVLWLLAVPMYWYIAPAGNAAHQYYANVFLLPLMLLAAQGSFFLSHRRHNAPWQIGMSLVLVLALIYNTVRTSAYFFHNLVPAHHLDIAQEIEMVIPKGQKIVYLAVNNSVPFSLAHRQGWMLGGAPTDVNNTATDVLAMKQYGAQYAVFAFDNNDFPKEEQKLLEQQSEVIYRSKVLTVFKL